MTDETEDVSTFPLEYGGFYNRMIATTIDLGILYMIALPVVDLIMGHLYKPVDLSPVIALINASGVENNPPQFIHTLWQTLAKQQALQRLLVQNLLQVFCIALYVLPFWFRFSTTPGKMIFRLEIRDATTGAPMTHKQAVVRFLGYIVSTLSFSLGFAWVLVNKRRRGFHDIIANTVVVVGPKSNT